MNFDRINLSPKSSGAFKHSKRRRVLKAEQFIDLFRRRGVLNNNILIT